MFRDSWRGHLLYYENLGLSNTKLISLLESGEAQAVLSNQCFLHTPKHAVCLSIKEL